MIVGILMSDIHKTTLLLVAVSGYFFFGALGQLGMQRWAVGLAAAFAALGLRNVVVSSESFEKHVISIVAVSAIIVVAVQWIMILRSSGGFLIPLGQLAAVIVAMIAAVGIATSPTPWQARESVHTATDMIPGWVIGEDTRWLRVLTDTKPRRVQLLRVADIEARRITP